ncbi:radical SAM protein [Candidatus Woesearchaeota archaeon]|nr:radical SAM protein [Candidatus Woesearchaeota archaeon]
MNCYDLKVGYSCNNNCVHCVIKDHYLECKNKNIPVDLTYDELKNQIIGLPSQGFDAVTLTGGEPTFRRDIVDLIKLINSLGMTVFIQTNGRAFYYPEFSDKFKDLNVSGFVIAVHGSNSQIHDSITQKNGSFNQTIKGIQNLVSLNKYVVGKVVISKKNMSDLLDIIKILSDIGVSRTVLSFPHGLGNAWKYRDVVIPRYSDLKDVLYSVFDYAKLNGVSLSIETFPFCFLREQDYMFNQVFSQGEKYYVKNVESSEFDWNSVRIQIKKKFDFCNSCIMNQACEGPWEEYVDLYGYSEFSPILKK